MEKISVIGLDLAKNVFQVHGAGSDGKKRLSKKLKRSELLEFFAKMPRCLVGLEACGGAHEWARRLEALGFTVKMMAPQHVKPYVQGNKTDARDAAAICEAASRPAVPAIAIRTRDSQQMQCLHRVREGWMKQRTAVMNRIRGLLGEFGVAVSRGEKSLRLQVRQWQAEQALELPLVGRLMDESLDELDELDKRLAEVMAMLSQAHQADAASQLIASIPGVGPLSATAVISSFGRAQSFSNARKFASAIGLTPREHSSGGKQRLGGISKRGNSYIRKLLVHGARAVLWARMKKPDYADDWVVQLAQRRGHNVAVCALAAKNARRIWAILHSDKVFNPEHAKMASA